MGGVFIQMEDEIASLGAILGASMGGIKSMTATSGPGFSLKQENLGYGAMAEIPCVVINVMRGGPSTGMPTRPAQGDVMQARWGTHGDHPIIVLTPASVPEVYEQTVRAFNLSERLRVPVVVLLDETIGHLMETVELPEPGSMSLVDRKWASGPAEDFLPYRETDDGVPAMARPGDGYRCHITGLTHGENGFPTQDPENVDRMMRRMLGKLDRHRDVIEAYETVDCEDADVLVVAFRHHVPSRPPRGQGGPAAGHQGRPVSPDHALAVSRGAVQAGRGTRQDHHRRRDECRAIEPGGGAAVRRPDPAAARSTASTGNPSSPRTSSIESKT